MGDGSISMVEGLGVKTVDSNEVRMKQRSFINSRTQSPNSRVSKPTSTTPAKFTDLCSDLHNSSMATPTIQYSLKPSFVQSSVYPQRSKSGASKPSSPSSRDPESSSVAIHAQTLNPQIFNPVHFISDLPDVSSVGNPSTQNPNPNPTTGSSPSRKLTEVFQQAGEQMDKADRVASLVQNIEDEMHSAGINVNFTKLKEQLLQMQGSESTLDGEFVDIYCNSPRHFSDKIPHSGIPVVKPDLPLKTKTHQEPKEVKTQPKNWSALFKAQAPSKAMKLTHYPDVKRGEDAHVDFDDSQLDDGMGNHCLIGHFLDGKMPLPLLSATARAVWKDHGKFTVKQMGSCYLFEFEDEASKMGVLEGGPYFFSRRYLVLKEWKRMLVPSKNHPSSIPVWIKLHRLPLEFWTNIGFSKIGSAIGRPIHVDEATANKRRLDYACICVEIEAGEHLPSDITISVNDEHVTIGVEYQWLPPQCENCKVFGHTCSSKSTIKPTTSPEEWVVVGKGKLPSSSTLKTNLTEEDSGSLPTQSEIQGSLIGVALPKNVQTQSLPQHNTNLALDPPSSETVSTSLTPGSAVTKPSDDTLSETMDEEFVVYDREVVQISSTPDKAKVTQSIQGSKGTPTPGSGGQKFYESNSSKKRRLKQERKLRKQGSS